MKAGSERLWIEAVDSPLGPLLVVCDEAGRLRALDFHDHEARMQRLLRVHTGEHGFELAAGSAPVAIVEALTAYFAGSLDALAAIEVRTGGSGFQRRVWSELRRIPCGATRSYGEIARAIGKPGASRAVGRANGANPVVIATPCHRVIGADGSLTGFGGGLERKRWLLEHEREWCPASLH